MNTTLGEGSFGIVQLGILRNKQMVACKRKSTHMVKTEETKEKEILDLISQWGGHPNIIKYFGEIETGSCTYLVLELMKCTLKEYIEQEELGRALQTQLYLDLLDGIIFLHAHQIIHEDLSDTNVLITEGEPLLKISDFGSSRIGLSSSNAITSLKFGAPEKYFDSPESSPKADIFSLGCILYTLRTGRAFLHTTSSFLFQTLDNYQVEWTRKDIQKLLNSPTQIDRKLKKSLRKLTTDSIPSEEMMIIFKLCHPNYVQRPTAIEAKKEFLLLEAKRSSRTKNLAYRCQVKAMDLAS